MIKIKIQDQKHKYSILLNQILHFKLTKPMNNQSNQI